MQEIGSLMFILTLLYLPLTHGESHLVCKTMGEIFGTNENVTGQIQRGMQGATGKRGPQGQKGEKGSIGPKGSKGEEGLVDYNRVNITVQESIRHLLTRIERLERLAGCPILVEGNCFIPLIDKRYSLDEAQAACSQRSGKLADITSKVTLDFIMNTIRSNFLSGSPRMTFWLGMTITPSDAKVVLSDGTDAPYLKWYPGYPSSRSGNTGIVLRVNSDAASTSQYFYNIPPTNTYNVLCQI